MFTRSIQSARLEKRNLMLEIFVALIVIIFMALFVAMSLPMMRERGRVTHRNQNVTPNESNATVS
jgi:hypothetical protein